MSAGVDWTAAFPIRPATDAVDVLLDGWRILASVPRPNFHPGMKEPALTKALKAFVEVLARDRGIFGLWAAESVHQEILDPITMQLSREKRTDILYGWNDTSRQLELVFEFKKVGRQKKHRDHYLRDKGLGRFVSGAYSPHQSVAAMVGILVDPEDQVVPAMRDAFDDPALATELRLRPTAAGSPIERPSLLFGRAHFDTEHDRDPARCNGAIRVAHFFLVFGYPTDATNNSASAVSAAA